MMWQTPEQHLRRDQPLPLRHRTPNTETFSYSRLANSDLLEKTTCPDNIAVTRSYEAIRNLLTAIDNKVGTTSVAKYDYTNDPIGNRQTCLEGGQPREPTTYTVNTVDGAAVNPTNDGMGRRVRKQASED